MGSFLDYIEEDGTVDWPRPPASIYRGNKQCLVCGDWVEHAFDMEACIKDCHGWGSHTIGHNVQLWLSAVVKWCRRYESWLKKRRIELQLAARRLGASAEDVKEHL